LSRAGNPDQNEYQQGEDVRTIDTTLVKSQWFSNLLSNQVNMLIVVKSYWLSLVCAGFCTIWL